MFTKKTFLSALALTLAISAPAFAAPRMWSKVNGNYDSSMSQRPSSGERYTTRSAPVEQTMATAPTETRRFSYEPNAKAHAAPEQSAAATPKQTTAKQQTARTTTTRSTRRYSYEPATNVRSMSSMRSHGRWVNSLSKGDPHRYDF